MEEVVVNKRRGRRPNSSTKRIQEVLEPENVDDINVSSLQDSADISVEQTVSNETSGDNEIKPTNDECPETENTSNEVRFVVGGENTQQKPYTTQHKYIMGDVVWIPELIQQQTCDGYGIIELKCYRQPVKRTIAAVMITNNVCYTFREVQKTIVAEQYVCDTKEQCVKLCEELNK